MSKKKSCILIGVGKQAKRLVDAIKGSKFEIEVLVARDRIKAQNFIDENNIAPRLIVDKLDTVITDSALDVAFVTTPDAAHYSYAKKLIECGKAVYLEKPVSLESAQAIELLALVRRVRQKLFVGYHFREISPLIHIKQLISDGYFGQIKEISMSWSYVPIGDSGWRNKLDSWWCSSILSTHCVDFILWVFGWDSIAEYSGKLSNEIYSKNDDTNRLELELKNRIKVKINCSLGIEKPLAIKISSIKGDFCFDRLLGKDKSITLSESNKIIFDYKNPWQASVESFYHYIQNSFSSDEILLSSVVNVFIFENLHKIFSGFKSNVSPLESLYAVPEICRS